VAVAARATEVDVAVGKEGGGEGGLPVQKSALVHRRIVLVVDAMVVAVMVVAVKVEAVKVEAVTVAATGAVQKGSCSTSRASRSLRLPARGRETKCSKSRPQAKQKRLPVPSHIPLVNLALHLRCWLLVRSVSIRSVPH
jgi:hypothetical protein